MPILFCLAPPRLNEPISPCRQWIIISCRCRRRLRPLAMRVMILKFSAALPPKWVPKTPIPKADPPKIGNAGFMMSPNRHQPSKVMNCQAMMPFAKMAGLNYRPLKQRMSCLPISAPTRWPIHWQRQAARLRYFHKPLPALTMMIVRRIHAGLNRLNGLVAMIVARSYIFLETSQPRGFTRSLIMAT